MRRKEWKEICSRSVQCLYLGEALHPHQSHDSCVLERHWEATCQANEDERSEQRIARSDSSQNGWTWSKGMRGASGRVQLDKRLIAPLKCRHHSRSTRPVTGRERNGQGVSSVHPELRSFNLDREGSTWLPRTSGPTSTGSSPRGRSRH